MWHLYQYPLCPFSRKVRLVLGELKQDVRLVLEYPWDASDTLSALNPAMLTPVLVDKAADLVLCDSAAIIDYLDETAQAASLFGEDAPARAEVRRLVGWFDSKFYAEVGVLLLEERMYARLVARSAPNTAILRQAMAAADQHLDYLAYLLDHRRWLGGPDYSMADIAAAAHLSVADYLGGIDWRPHEQVKQWYSAVKSRPNFRPLLSERMAGLPPVAHYDKLDF